MKGNRKLILAVLGAMVLILAFLGSVFYSQMMLPERELRFASDNLLPYRVEIVTNRDSTHYTKSYLLHPEENPDLISKESFWEDGVKWNYVKTEATPKLDKREKEYEHTVSFESSSKDLKILLGMLPVEKAVTTEDGYQGMLLLNPSSVEAKAKGYMSKTVTLKEERSYYNLSSQDLSNVPKSITKDGKLYLLQDVFWQSINTETVDGYRIPDRFMATAAYEAQVKQNIATGFLVEASYTGMVEKDVTEGMLYTIWFEKCDGLFGSVWGFLLAGLLVIVAVAVFVTKGGDRFRKFRESRKTIEERW